MKSITTSDGFEVLVSDEDFEFLNQFGWSSNSKGAVHRRVNGKLSAMHHEIALKMGLKFSLIDHKDRNPFNNQRSNLRIASKSTNGMNRGSQRNNIYSDYKGVTFSKQHRRWKAYIKAGSTIFQKLFDTEKDAALAYNEWALKLHGEFAYLNEIS